MKLIHRWQNIGSQKQQFYLAKSTSLPKDEKTKESENIGKCPTGCGEFEIQLHYLLCKHTAMITAQENEKAVLVGSMSWMYELLLLPCSNGYQ